MKSEQAYRGCLWSQSGHRACSLVSGCVGAGCGALAVSTIKLLLCRGLFFWLDLLSRSSETAPIPNTGSLASRLTLSRNARNSVIDGYFSLSSRYDTTLRRHLSCRRSGKRRINCTWRDLVSTSASRSIDFSVSTQLRTSSVKL